MTCPIPTFSPGRYETMKYRFCGHSGLKLPLLSLGLWQNFGGDRPYAHQQAIVHRAFDLGITHFDLSNNYGPPVGAAEQNFGKILRDGLGAYRRELVISTKAGYRAWPGPYGDGGSRKYLIAACEDSLRRTGLEYFDIFYHHRMDTEVPVDETMGALDQLVRQGKALYIGVSSHTGAHFAAAARAIKKQGLTRLTSLMSRYNLLQRDDENDKWPIAAEQGVGGVAFCPLAQGLLTSKYLGDSAPAGSRMAHEIQNGGGREVLLENIKQARLLNEIARARGQTLAQMALAWVLRQPGIASALIGASSPAQVEENVGALAHLEFSAAELARIDAITRAPKSAELPAQVLPASGHIQTFTPPPAPARSGV
ncbi:MAG: aldo/keto reductase [Phycisphaerae bacterium]